MSATSDKVAPKGFCTTTSADGHPAITYRTSGMGCVALFLFCWLAFWISSTLFFTILALFGKPQIDYFLLLFMVPFWAAGFSVLGYALWYLRSITVFTFCPDRLVIERSLFGYRRHREVLRENIEVVRQIKDGGEGEDSFPSWGLAIEGRSNIKLLSRQEIEKSAWFGPLVASWAGVKYEGSSDKKKYEEV